jgi:multiple sugar transport system substrate-binding protein
MKCNRLLVGLVLVSVSVSVFAAGGSESAASDAAVPQPVTIFASAAFADEQEPMAAAFAESTGVDVEYKVVPGQAAEIYQKIDISLMSGDATDLLLANPVYFNKVARAELGLRLNDFIASDPDYDAAQVHGDYLETYNDGGIYGLPFSTTLWAVFYNKQIFDDAGVDYPTGDWTWEEYIDTAKQLNDEDRGIYGSYMPTYDNVFHIPATMAGVSAYKEDGSSNFDHPIFAEGLEFYRSLSAEHSIQPSWTEQRLKKLGSFHFLGGQNGMMVISSWYLNPITDFEKYPRDWEIGITSLPRFTDFDENNNFGATASIVVNSNSENPEGAYEYAKFVALNNHQYTNRFPPFREVTEDDIVAIFESVESGTRGQVTVDDLFNAYFDNGLGFHQEKLGGIIGSEYSNLLKQEGELYILGDQTLAETVQAILERANKAIEEAR